MGAQGRRGDALHAVGSAPEGRPFDALDRGLPALRARGHDDPHGAARGAADPRRRVAMFEDMRVRFDRGGGEPRRRPSSSPPSSPNATARIAKAGRSRFLVEPNVKDGKGGSARPQHACSGSPNTSTACASASELVAGRPVLAQGIPAVLPLRGVPVAGALPPALRHRARRGAPVIRPAAPAWPSGWAMPDRAGLLRRRAVHEALLPDRQGGRRPHRDRLRRPRGAPGQALADARSLLRPHLATPQGHARATRTSSSRTRGSPSRDPATFARDPDQPHPPVRASPTRAGWRSIPDAMRLVTMSLTKIDRDGCAPIRRGQSACSCRSSTSRNSPAVVLRLMNQAGVLGRFIPEFGRIVALMQFNMYHSYTVDEHLIRADRHPRRDREPAAARSSIRWRRSCCRRSRTARCSTSPCSCTISPRAVHGGPFARRRQCRAESSARGSASTTSETQLRRLADRAAPGDVRHRAAPRPRRPADDRDLRQAVVGTVDRLNMLLVLTICDIRAVGPGVWNQLEGGAPADALLGDRASSSTGEQSTIVARAPGRGVAHATSFARRLAEMERPRLRRLRRRAIRRPIG